MTNADEQLQELVKNCKNVPFQGFTSDASVVSDTLSALKIPQNSMLGALASTGGFSLSGGKLRLFGSPKAELRSIRSVNASLSHDPLQSYLIVAEDIFGNFYAINVAYSAAFRPGEMIAFFADGTDWESTADSLADFLSYCFEGDLTPTFSDFETGDAAMEKVAAASQDRVISFYPPLFTKEGSPHSSSKKTVPAHEELSLRLTLTAI